MLGCLVDSYRKKERDRKKIVRQTCSVIKMGICVVRECDLFMFIISISLSGDGPEANPCCAAHLGKMRSEHRGIDLHIHPAFNVWEEATQSVPSYTYFKDS